MLVALAAISAVRADDPPANQPIAVNVIRQAYIAEVMALRAVADEMKGDGKSPEEIARNLHQRRRDLGVKYKAMTPPDLLEKIYARNLDKYGDKLGPTIDFLRKQGHTWEEIIRSAATPGGADLGLASQPLQIQYVPIYQSHCVSSSCSPGINARRCLCRHRGKR